MNKGMVLTKLTQTQINANTNMMDKSLVYNITLSKCQIWRSGAWSTLNGSGNDGNILAWSLPATYAVDSLVFYTDGNCYISNGAISANTAWSIGTTGATWSLVNGYNPIPNNVTLPLINGVANAGTSISQARADHIHPRDFANILAWVLTKAYKSGDVVANSGSYYIANADIPANTTWATGTTGATWKILYDLDAIKGTATPIESMAGIGAMVGTSNKYAREDHVHEYPVVNVMAWNLANAYLKWDMVSYTDGELYIANNLISGNTAWAVGTTGATWRKITGNTSEVNLKANIASPALTGVPTAPTATAGDNSTQLATTAFVSNAITTGVVGAVNYRGSFTPSVTSGATGYPTTGGSGTAGAIRKGDMFVAGSDGYILTEKIQTGDFIICNTDTPGQTDTKWDKIQRNIAYVAEDSANKVTAFSSPTDVQYPSAKLVNDQLGLKANISSPTFTGVPLSTTPVADDNTTKIATTAYVLGQLSSTAPVMNGTATIGTATKMARADHIHPSDTAKVNVVDVIDNVTTTTTNKPLSANQGKLLQDNKEDKTNKVTAFSAPTDTQYPSAKLVNDQLGLKSPINSPTFTGAPKAVTPAADDNTTNIATTAFVLGQLSSTAPVMNGTVAIGTSVKSARADHIHPSDTSKLNWTEYQKQVPSLAPFNGNGGMGDLTGWSQTMTGNTGTDVTFGIDSSKSFRGTNSLKLTTVAGGKIAGYGTYVMQVAAGQKYNFGVAIWGANTIPNGISVVVRESSTFPTGGYVTSALQTSSTSIVSGIGGTSAWDVRKGSYTVPGTIKWISIEISQGSNGGSDVWFDVFNFELQKSATDLAGVEATINKVTAFSTPTDTQYPSAKLVSDQLALKANLASPALTGTPTAPTATAGDNTTNIATTAFVGTAITNNNTTVNASIALKSNIASPTFTGTVSAPTPAVDDNTTKVATTAYVLGQLSSTAPLVDGTATVGTSTKIARADHVHPLPTMQSTKLGLFYINGNQDIADGSTFNSYTSLYNDTSATVGANIVLAANKVYQLEATCYVSFTDSDGVYMARFTNDGTTTGCFGSECYARPVNYGGSDFTVNNITGIIKTGASAVNVNIITTNAYHVARTYGDVKCCIVKVTEITN